MRNTVLRAGSRGIALVIVLWVVVLLTVIVSSFVFQARGQTRLTGNLEAGARAEALADAGVYRGIYEQFKSPTDRQRWWPDGRVHDIGFGEARLQISIMDETAYIDLNAAREPLLLGLLTSAGVEVGQAQALVDAMIDWRDADDLSRPSGAERDAYAALGKVGPANVNFRTVEELKAVLGMTPELFGRIKGALTVYSNAPGINAIVAPRQVLMALPGAEAGQVDAFIAARQAELDAGLTPTPFPPAGPYSVSGSDVYNVRSIARLDEGTEFVREAVLRLTGDPKQPISFLDWREGQP